jgi:hypothetical protein
VALYSRLQFSPSSYHGYILHTSDDSPLANPSRTHTTHATQPCTRCTRAVTALQTRCNRTDLRRAVPWLMCATSAVNIKGQPKGFATRSSNQYEVKRWFCPECGS